MTKQTPKLEEILEEDKKITTEILGSEVLEFLPDWVSKNQFEFIKTRLEIAAEQLDSAHEIFIKKVYEAGGEAEKEKKKGEIEQAMVYLFKKLPEYLEPKRYMSEKRKDSLWSHMCMWIDEYIDNLQNQHETK